MKKLSGVIIALLLGIVMLFGIAGCGSLPKGTLYTLQEAYDNGWLTQEDLQTIASYHHDNTLYHESLDENIAKSIKKEWAKEYNKNITNSETKITEEDVSIKQYYGTYNGCVIVIVDIKAFSIAAYFPYVIEIGNIKFEFNAYGPKAITVWKEKN